MRLSRIGGGLLWCQFLVACYFAIRNDWTWFAIAALGCFVIVMFDMEDS